MLNNINHWEMQNKTSMRYYHTPVRMAKGITIVKRTIIASADKNENNWNSHTMGMQNGTDTLGNSLAISYEIKLTFTT